MAHALSLDPDVLAAQGGDREAFTRLIDATRNVVSSIVFAILRDVAESEDVAQEVFLAAWQGLTRLRNPSSFLPWLRQLARNQAHHVARGRRRRRSRVAELDAADELLATAADPSPTAREHLVSTEERQVLAEVMELLPDEAREVITLFYREGRSARQVADLLGIREEAVKKRLERARAALRAEMLDRFGETMRRTAPGAAFTAVVAASLTISAPAAAATTATAVGSGALKGTSKLVVGLGGAGLGVVAGLAGVLFNFRRRMGRARDPEERRQLRRMSLLMGAMVVALSVLIQVSAAIHSPVLLVGSWVVMLPIYCDAFLRRLPRIVHRRYQAELAEDPEAWRRHRRERWCNAAGVAFGAIVGSATIVWAALSL
ncbi:MAG TPA: sigma-70 family RNA polymerase sigma factor [Kofleriaceae bacterium]|nr:sigma-70 family RNA polymerase sigma factor [Kofleriaceae bacterium]